MIAQATTTIDSNDQNRFWTLSNFISILRAFLAIPIIYYLYIGDKKTALIYIAVAIVTDTLDGWLARVRHAITDYGKVLDPIADKVVIFSVMLFLWLHGNMPLYYFAFLLLRDLTISVTGFCMYRYRSHTPRANFLGKVSIVLTAATIMTYLYDIIAWQRPLMLTSMVFLTISWIIYAQTYLHKAYQKVETRPAGPSSRLTLGLARTEKSIAARLPLLGKYFRIEADVLAQIEDTLLGADVGVEFTEILMERLRAVDRKEASRLDEILKNEIKALMGADNHGETTLAKPHVILIVGVNGTGKTTTIGKLGAKFAIAGRKVLVVAADTFRAAAFEQLQVWTERANVDLMGNPQGKDPSAVVFDAMKAAVARDKDVVIIDTAGRLHTKSNLMEELGKIKRVIGKVIPGAPQDVWLVLDATTGQNGLAQAQEFMSAVGITGVILTKLDGTAKGGIVLSVHRKFNIPIKYLGIGEKLDDLVEFDPGSYVDALLSVAN